MPSREYNELPQWYSGKEPACQCRRHGFDPWVRKIPGEVTGNPLQNSCLENSMDRGAGGGVGGGQGVATIHWGHKESDTTEQLSTTTTIREYNVCKRLE